MLITMEFDAAKKRTVRHIVCDRCSARRQYNFRTYKTTLCQDCRQCLTPEQQKEWQVTPADLAYAIARLEAPTLRTGAINHNFRKLAA